MTQQKATQQKAATNQRGFAQVGNGKAIHYLTLSGKGTLCGAEGTGSGQVRFGISGLRVVTGPATCKRCLKMMGDS